MTNGFINQWMVLFFFLVEHWKMHSRWISTPFFNLWCSVAIKTSKQRASVHCIQYAVCCALCSDAEYFIQLIQAVNIVNGSLLITACNPIKLNIWIFSHSRFVHRVFAQFSLVLSLFFCEHLTCMDAIDFYFIFISLLFFFYYFHLFHGFVSELTHFFLF